MIRTHPRAQGAPRLESAPLAARTERVEPIDAIDFLEAREGQPRFLYWHRGRGVAGAGIAADVRAEGPDRFDDVRTAADAVLRVLIHERAPGVPADMGPVWLGAFSFLPEADGRATWPPARFVLASEQLRVTDEGHFHTTLDALEDPPAAEPSAPAGPSPWRQEPGFAAWETMVRAALADIAGRRLEKVVLSRTIRRGLGARFRVASLLRALVQSAPDARVFLFEPAPGAAFLCASPELLVRRRGDELEAQAMAGSRPRGHTRLQDEALARQLLGSAKDVREHEIVARFVQTALSQLGYMWEAVQKQRVVKLPNVQHIETRFRAEGATKDHVVTLAKALHPTPAVAGWPREPALELIRRLERGPRGWYAGPVGWFDRAGEGEFAVALRCARFEGGEALLHAGCGILRGSLPVPEWQESETKLHHLRALIDAEVDGSAEKP